jgi:hypothetical protein
MLLMPGHLFQNKKTHIAAFRFLLDLLEELYFLNCFASICFLLLMLSLKRHSPSGSLFL